MSKVDQERGYRMVPRKTWVSDNFGTISEVFLIGLEVSFPAGFFNTSRSFEFFLPTGL